MELYKPITENLKLDMRMNLKTKKVRIAGARGGRRPLWRGCGCGRLPATVRCAPRR